MSDETEFAREPCLLLTDEIVLTVDGDLVAVRVSGKGESKVRVGMLPDHAMRIGAAFIRAALRLDPSLRLQVIEDELSRGRKPVVVAAGVEA